MQIIYRKIRSDESPEYRRVRLECLKTVPEVFGTVYEDEVGKAKLYFEELIEQNSAEAIFFGAFDGDNLIGTAGFVRGERTKTRHLGEIVGMYVNPDFLGQKVGENLLRVLAKAVFELNSIEQIYLTVIADNVPAVRLYEKIGFESFGIQENYFKSGEKYWNRRFMQLTREKFTEENPQK